MVRVTPSSTGGGQGHFDSTSGFFKLDKKLLNVREPFRNQPGLGIEDKNQKVSDLGIYVYLVVSSGPNICFFFHRKYRDFNSAFYVNRCLIQG